MLFFFAHNGDVVAVRHFLRSLDEAYPEQVGHHFPQSFLEELRHSHEKREQFRIDVSAGVSQLAERTVDVAKWPGIDLGHAALVAVAVEGCKALRAGATNLVDYEDPADFDRRVRALRAALVVAIRSVEKVMKECERATDQLLKEHASLS